MFLLKKILSALILPPVGLLLAAAGGLFLMRRHRRAGMALSLSALGLLLVLSLPVTRAILLEGLEQHPVVTAEQLKTVQVLVVLGGGSNFDAPEYGMDTVGSRTLERVRYAALLHRRSGLPLLLTGGSPYGGRAEALSMQAALEELGVSARWVEPASRDTAENARYSAAMLLPEGRQRIALVSHAWHLPRAVELFERAGFEVVPAPLGFSRLPADPLARWLPTSGDLDGSTAALREWLGRLAQRLPAS